MARTLVSRDELHRSLNERLHEQDPCGECHFTKAPTPLRAPDATGRNWSQDLILNRSRSASTACGVAAVQTIADVALHFDVGV